MGVKGTTCDLYLKFLSMPPRRVKGLDMPTWDCAVYSAGYKDFSFSRTPA
jgi:hypothetical protein